MDDVMDMAMTNIHLASEQNNKQLSAGTRTSKRKGPKSANSSISFINVYIYPDSLWLP
jgi:hypothetical protein